MSEGLAKGQRLSVADRRDSRSATGDSPTVGLADRWSTKSVGPAFVAADWSRAAQAPVTRDARQSSPMAKVVIDAIRRSLSVAESRP